MTTLTNYTDTNGRHVHLCDEHATTDNAKHLAAHHADGPLLRTWEDGAIVGVDCASCRLASDIGDALMHEGNYLRDATIEEIIHTAQTDPNRTGGQFMIDGEGDIYTPGMDAWTPIEPVLTVYID